MAIKCSVIEKKSLFLPQNMSLWVDGRGGLSFGRATLIGIMTLINRLSLHYNY